MERGLDVDIFIADDQVLNSDDDWDEQETVGDDDDEVKDDKNSVAPVITVTTINRISHFNCSFEENNSRTGVRY